MHGIPFLIKLRLWYNCPKTAKGMADIPQDRFCVSIYDDEEIQAIIFSAEEPCWEGGMHMQKSISWTQADCILAGAGQMPFLIELKEMRENSLHLMIQGAAVEEKTNTDDACGNPVLEQILSQCKPIVPDCSQEFHIVFEDYIIYQVRNESYASFDALAQGSGVYLREFTKSHLLDYLPTATDAIQLEDDTFYPAPWKHYGIYTQNHIVDIIAQEEPTILYWDKKTQ